MIKKTLTYFTILAITLLPVELISANAESVNMLISMTQQNQVSNHCLQNKTEQISTTEKVSINKSCCDESSHDCQGCNNFSSASGAMFFPANTASKSPGLKNSHILISHLNLNGIPQQNPLRPPRTQI